MVNYKIKRTDFYMYIFQPYNLAVKEGRYKKIPYTCWRTIRDWCCEARWAGYDIVVTPGDGGYNITLAHDEKTYPEVCFVTYRLNEDGFGSYLFNNRKTLVMYAQCEILTEKEEKENNNMKFGNFEFGPVQGDVRLSMYGMAVKNASGNWVAYDAANKKMMDVDILNFKGGERYMYKIPVAIKDIAVGDTIIHGRKPLFVVAVRNDGKLACVDPIEGEERVILVSHSPFGFDFVTKVVSLFNFSNANADAPFGNMLPLLMLSEDKDIDPLMLFAMSGNTSFASNPMMMYALMSDNKDMMLPLMLSGAFSGSPLLQTGNSGACAETPKE